MRNCIKADILRVQRKKGLIIMSIIIMLIIAIAGIVARTSGDKGPDRFFLILSATLGFNTLMLGIPVFNAVLGDDFKSKSMQTAIGHGLSRDKLILARLIEIIVIVIEAYIVFLLGILIFGLIGGVDMKTIGDTIQTNLDEILCIIGFSAVSMIFVYGTQNGVLGLVFYILLGASVFDIIISAISLLPFLRDTDFNLGDYVISGMATKVVQASSFGTGALWFLAFLVFWVALPTFIAMQIFKNKELDF